MQKYGWFCLLLTFWSTSLRLHDVHHRHNPIQRMQALVILMSTADADQHHHNTTRSLPDNPGYLICLLVHFCLRAGGDRGLVVVFKVKVEISTFDE